MDADSTVPENAPENCPGTESEDAGKAAACAGCPNQQACQSAPKGPDQDLPLINDRMSTIKHKILVLSGKGGVGKSTVAAQLSWVLASRNYEVGLLDVDICGPSVPRMMGVENEIVRNTNIGWTPVYREANLGIISVSFLLQNQEDAVIWRGPKKNGLIKNFVRDVYWGDVDYLIVDTPPGTSDEHLSIVQFLKESKPDGAIIVTTPQDVALSDVRKEISFCKKAGLPILGVVENMSGFVCPKCKNATEIFRPARGGGKGLADEFNVPFLGSIPLDPRLMKACEEGVGFVEAFADSPAAVALSSVTDRIMKKAKAKETVIEATE